MFRSQKWVKLRLSGGGQRWVMRLRERQREVWKHPNPAFLDMPDIVQVLGTEQWAKQTMPLLLYEEPNTHSPEDSKCSRGMKIACWVPSAGKRKNNCRPRWWWIRNKAKKTEKVGEHFIGNMPLQLGTEVYVALQRPRHGDWKFKGQFELEAHRVEASMAQSNLSRCEALTVCAYVGGRLFNTSNFSAPLHWELVLWSGCPVISLLTVPLAQGFSAFIMLPFNSLCPCDPHHQIIFVATS